MLGRDKDADLRELEHGSEVVRMAQLGMIQRDEAIALLHVPWWRRAWERVVGWFRRKPILTCGMGMMSRRQYRETLAFARESGNVALLECLRKKA